MGKKRRFCDDDDDDDGRRCEGPGIAAGLNTEKEEEEEVKGVNVAAFPTRYESTASPSRGNQGYVNSRGKLPANIIVSTRSGMSL